MELAVISNFHYRRHHRGIELGTFRSQACHPNRSATDSIKFFPSLCWQWDSRNEANIYFSKLLFTLSYIFSILAQEDKSKPVKLQRGAAQGNFLWYNLSLWLRGFLVKGLWWPVWSIIQTFRKRKLHLVVFLDKL